MRGGPIFVKLSRVDISSNRNMPFYNYLLGLTMLVSRYGLMIPVLAIGGSLAAKKHVPVGP